MAELKHTCTVNSAVTGEAIEVPCLACDFDTVSSLALSRAGKRGTMREKAVGSLSRINAAIAAAPQHVKAEQAERERAIELAGFLQGRERALDDLGQFLTRQRNSLITQESFNAILSRRYTEAQLRAARGAVDALESQFLLEHRTYSVSDALRRAFECVRARLSAVEPATVAAQPNADSPLRP